MRGTLILTVGSNGGFYIHRHRICLWLFAVTWYAFDADDIMRAGIEALEKGEV